MVVRVSGVELEMSKTHFIYKCLILCLVTATLGYNGARAAYDYSTDHVAHSAAGYTVP